MSLSGSQEKYAANEKKLPIQLEMIRFLTEINKKISDGLDCKKLLDFVFDSLDLIIPYDRIGVAVAEGEGDAEILRLVWVKSKMPVTHLNLSYSASVKGSSLQQILMTGKPRIINDLIKYSADHPQSLSTRLVIQDGIRSSLTCPLRAENKQVGVVFFSSVKPNTYEDEHVETFLEIANELSVIVEHGRLKSEFASVFLHKNNMNMILHDLKSPLSTMQGFAELALQAPWYKDIDREGQEVFQVFIKNSRYMFDLLNSLLEIGRIEQNRDALLTKNVQLREFAEEMINFAKILASPKEITLVANIASDLPSSATFDRFKVQRVLDNLFSNAVKYSNRGNKIVFDIGYIPGRIIFSVQDFGPGIPKSELPKLFHEFGKTSVRPTEGETSTGLGLAIAKKLVNQHAGQITVTSEVGKGSTFTFWIPLSGAATVH